MTREELIMACTCDIAGKVRGKSFPASQLEKRLKRGIGWTPTNVQITCFDNIAETPFGSFGDLVLIPDVAATMRLPEEGAPSEVLMLGDIRHTDGKPWEFCTRSILRDALARLEYVAGLTLNGTFEHEFQIRGEEARPGTAFSSAGFREWRAFGETLIAAMRDNGIAPDTFLREFGPGQFEVTMDPSQGIAIADQAVILRELVHAVAARFGKGATFVPIRSPDAVGNGVHVHMSLMDSDGNPATHDPEGKHELSRHAGQFVAGILKYLDAFTAITAPSVVSYLRLTPHRWSAAFNNLGFRDREAALRICPVSDISDLARARQFHFEFRAADAAASPYLLLAALVHAGAQGIEEELDVPEAMQQDLSLLSPQDLAASGHKRLPQTLEKALDAFAANDTVASWFPEGFTDLYVKHKQGEAAIVAGLDPEDQCRRYEEVY
ncbi:glutamine synthetase family protein [Roseovarius sp. Pro17]|uniref:glutamine synthetase family protein n=1 Tax=Roseovarius sp. Pro17 TaxID=3108175 RepID=UPI002D76D224|nr:glutamine synthetase family protein [Roseovarius sp. Pro17]